jgi:hypothetical protein
MSGRATPMIDVSMITMNCVSAMTASAVQRRGFADCVSGTPFLQRLSLE